MADGEVRIAWVGDRSQFDPVARSVDQTSQDVAKRAGEAAAAAAKSAKAAAESAAKAAASAAQKASAAVAESATKSASVAKAAVSQAAVALTDAERKMAAEIRAADAALRAKADALGLTVTQTKALESATRKAETAAKAQAATFKTAEKGIKTNTAATASLRQTLRYLPNQIGDVVQSVAAGQPAWRALSTQAVDVGFQLGNAASQMNLASSAGAVLAGVVGPLALAVGGAYLAWRVYSEDAKRAEETSKLVDSALKAMQPTLDSTRDATIRLRVATGELTAEQGALLTAATSAWRSYQTQTEETRKKVAELAQEQGGLKTQIVDGISAMLDVVDVAGINSRVFDSLTTSSDELQGQIDALTGAQGSQIEALRTNVKTTGDAIKAEGERKRGLEGLSAATKELEERTRRLDAVMKAQVAKQVDEAAEVLGIVVDATREFEAQAESFAMAAQATNGAITKSTVDSWRDLSAAVDAAVPAEALSRLDQLNYLLLNLELVAIPGTAAAAALADEIARVQDAISDELAGSMSDVADETERAATGAQRFGSALQSAVGAAGSIAGTIGNLIDTLTGGALSGLTSVGGIAQTAGSEDGGGMAAAAVDAAIAFVEELVRQLPSVLDAVADGIPRVLGAVTAAIPDIIQTIIARLPDIFDALAAGIPPLLVTIAEQVPQVLTAIINEIPALVIAIVEAVPDIIQALVAGLPDLIRAILRAIPEIIIGVVEAIPDIVQAVVEAVPVIVVALIEGIVLELLPRLPEITVALVKALAVTLVNLTTTIASNLVKAVTRDIPVMIGEFIKNLPEIVAKLASAGLEFAKNVIAGLGQFFGDLIKEITSLGFKKTATFGDTPGPVKVSQQGLKASFSPGDVVVAARSMAGVRAQVNQPAVQAPRESAMAPAPRLDLAAGHIAFDGLFKANIRQGGSLSGLRGTSTGQVRVYR